MSTALAVMLAFTVSTANAKNVDAKLVIDIGPLGVHSWILKAIQDGAFAKRGVNLKFVGKGPGAVKAAMAVTAGKADVSYQDYSGLVLVNSKSKDPKVTAIFVVDDKTQDAVWALKKSGIKKLSDLNGKKVGDFLSGVTVKTLPGVTDAKFTVINMHFKNRIPAMLSGEVDAIAGFLTSNKINLEKAGVAWSDINVIPMSDVFPMAVSRVLTVNSDFARANPNAVVAIREVAREYVAAFIKDPGPSVATLNGPVVSTDKKKAFELSRALYGISELVNTPFVQKHGISNAQALSPRLDEYTTLLVTKLGLPNRHPNNKYFDLD